MARVFAFGEAGNPETHPIVGDFKEARMSPTQTRNRAAQAKRDRWLRMQAVQVVTMLPDDPDEAQRVLDYAQALLNGFIASPEGALSLVKRD